MHQSAEHRRRMESLDREGLVRHQIARLNDLLNRILPHNRFYAEKLAAVARPLESLAELAAWPYTFKEELLGTHDNHNRAANLTWPLERYSRFHQTSGTHGRPMIVLDTADDWPWWLDCWQYVLDAAEIQPSDRVLFAFSFGPFIGFWSAFDAVIARGCLAIPGGGLSSKARLELLARSEANVICCTPGYALHLAEIAEEQKLDVGTLGVRSLILAGEPGGSLSAVRARIESAWRARVIDHAGASEVGPWGYGHPTEGGMFVNEAEFIAEFLSVETGGPANEGELAELVLTTLGRTGAPVIRYRTGDLVRPRGLSPFAVGHHQRMVGEKKRTVPVKLANQFVFLEGGIISRADEMLVIRGVNVFPTALEQILRSFPEVVEFRITARTASAMDYLQIEVEDRLEQPDRIADEVQLRLGLRVEVACVPSATLPRFEGKGKRFHDERTRTA